MQPEAPRLLVKTATWGPAQIPATATLQLWINSHGRGRFLYLPTLQAKIDLLGEMSGKQIDLRIAYAMDGSNVKEEVFSMHAEVLLGDIATHYAVLSEGHAQVNEKEANTLLSKFRPIMILHPSETSHPCRVEHYLQNTSLYLRVGDQQGKRYHTREMRRFFLHHNTKDLRYGERNNIANVPFYGTCYKRPDGYLCLVYFFFYAYNGPILQGMCIPSALCNSAGIHEGDWEHVCLLVTPRTHTLRAVYMSRHGKESRWYLRPQARNDADADDGWHVDAKSGRVLIWCGKESHANYNRSGGQPRGYGGYIDDHCAEGPWWRPQVVNVGSPAQPSVPWLLYGGLWGKLKDSYWAHDGPTGPLMKRSFVAPPHMTPQNTVPCIESWWTEQPID